ncbi:MAG TPA: hypothetical protein VEA60_10535, partial [Allosphingosinicella sp.]|nr:hypothetical protein [Allosphingosinicella sp.]
PTVFVLDRELSEVHLLLDNVSANPSTTLAERLAAVDGLDEDLPDDWIEQVCRISWPPEGSDDDKAEDAALLIKAKDRLNRLSYPASGSTIAFTLLVTQHDAKSQPWLRLGGGAGEGGEERSPTRHSLAQTAYPDLVEKAVRFRKAMRSISIALVAALIFTCLLSWYVAYGNSALAELAAAESALEVVNKRVSDAEAAEDNQLDAPAPAPRPAGAAKDGVVAAAAGDVAAAKATASDRFIPYCDRPTYASAAQSQACAAQSEARRNLERVKRRLAGWVCVISWDCVKDLSDYAVAAPAEPAAAGSLAAPAPPKETAESRRAALHNAELIDNAPSRAAALATIMGTAVLPFLYGLLGAGAAIIRSLSRKIRASLLSPRDLHLSFQQLALGAVVGACIGLFIAAPGSSGEGESLLGPVALSASAISFVAGFGVDSVFEALETLIKRIFNVAPPATGNRGDGVATT